MSNVLKPRNRVVCPNCFTVVNTYKTLRVQCYKCKSRFLVKRFILEERKPDGDKQLKKFLWYFVDKLGNKLYPKTRLYHDNKKDGLLGLSQQYN